MTPEKVIAEAMDEERMMYQADYQNAREILAALDKAGFAVVPKEPTEEMTRAAHASTAGWLGLPGHHSALSQALFKHARRYRAMLDAYGK